MTLEQLESLNAEQKARTVLVVQDPFTSYYDAQVVADFVRLVEKLGFQPVLLPFSPNGKAQHIKGFLNRFAKTAKKTADFLNRMAKLGMPMVGVDPALVLCYRDEYKLALGEERGEFNVLLANEWLASALESQPVATVSGESWYFFGHCTEVTALPGAPAQMGRDICPFWARNWKMSAWVAAAWQGLTDMKRKTIKIRSGSMSYPGIRLCSDCRVTAVWRPDIPAVAR
ncbi:putative FAD-binding oxidase [Escherichia coli]|uniref:Putative FAD-binding oxidase n=1 Tax=Escherichia coli TaxID=562 RepID=A0A2X3KD53_ECOLX|nr:putative FAD-binding oxidase [Escherichia coli]